MADWLRRQSAEWSTMLARNSTIEFTGISYFVYRFDWESEKLKVKSLHRCIETQTTHSNINWKSIEQIVIIITMEHRRRAANEMFHLYIVWTVRHQMELLTDLFTIYAQQYNML